MKRRRRRWPRCRAIWKGKPTTNAPPSPRCCGHRHSCDISFSPTMAELVTDCPRCKARKITFDVTQAHEIGQNFSWQTIYETFCICRQCQRATVFVLKIKAQSLGGHPDLVKKTGLLKLAGSLNRYTEIAGYINLSDMGALTPPEHLRRILRPLSRKGRRVSPSIVQMRRHRCSDCASTWRPNRYSRKNL